MTGFVQVATAVMQDWKVSMCRRRRCDLRAGSSIGVVGEEEEEDRFGSAAKAAVSRPDVKARGPAPERMMARVEGEVERWSKMVRSSSHILRTKGSGSVSVVVRALVRGGFKGKGRE